MDESLRNIDALITAGDVKKAEVFIAKLLRSRQFTDVQSKTQLYIRRARVRLLSARPDDALDDLQTIRDTTPVELQSPSFLELLGDCYFAHFELASVGFTDRNDTVLAQQLYEQIIQEHPKYNNLGWVYYQLGRILATTPGIEEATKCFQQALITRSHVSALTAYCYERLAFITFYEHRDLENALAFLNRAVDTYPASADQNWLAQVHLLRSRVLKGMKDYSSALNAAETAFSSLSGNTGDKKVILSEALLTIGELLSEIEGRDKEIIEILQQFIQNTRKPLGVDVTWSRVNEMMGNAYFNIAQYQNAVVAYSAALQFNPDHPWVVSLYYRIARSYYQQYAYEDAITAIQRMLVSAHTDGQSINDYHVYDILGNAQFALGRYEQAVEAYHTALQMSPPTTSINKIKSYYDLARERI